MKKVLVVAHNNMSLSGVPVVFMTVARLLHKEYNFDILLFDDSDMHFKKEFLSYGGNIFVFKEKKPKNKIFKLFYKLFFPILLNSFLKKEINPSKYDIIHCFREKNTYSILHFFKKNKNKKIIYHINSAASAYKTEKGLKNFIHRCNQKKAIRIANTVICVSKKVLDNWNYYGNCVLVLNCFNIIYYNSIIQKKDDDLSLCQIGTFSRRKNQLFSLIVLKDILAQIPSTNLYLVGKEAEQGYLKQLNQYIVNNNLVKNVHFLPPDYDKKQLYKNSSYLLFPSIKESFGLVILEAQACGVHCFASNTIPTDSDLGNIDFIELDAAQWSHSILDYYNKYRNNRSNPKDLNNFTEETFALKIRNIYES